MPLVNRIIREILALFMLYLCRLNAVTLKNCICVSLLVSINSETKTISIIPIRSLQGEIIATLNSLNL